MFKEKTLRAIKAAQEAWEEKNSEHFKREREELSYEVATRYEYESGSPAKRLYTPLDLEEQGFDYLKDVGLPGEYPFTSGITPTMYRGQIVGTHNYAGHALPEESNEEYKALIKAGQTMIFMAYDLPTQLGYDPDHPMADGEIGKTGINIISLRDFERTFEDIDIGKVPISQVMNAPAAVAIAWHLALAEKRGIDIRKVEGACQNDILKEYIARGNFIYPPEPSIRLTVDTLTYCGKYAPNYNPITIAGHVGNQGWMLANCFTFVQAGVDRGFDVDEFAPVISHMAGCSHTDFFGSIARNRAYRRLYARIMKERFGAKKPESMMAKLWADGGSGMTKEQVRNNIGRLTLSALAGVLGGVQSIEMRTYDELFGIPSVEAIIMSLRAEQVVAYETGTCNVIDPLAGSYYVESLTNETEEAIRKEIETIDIQGGVVKGLENGYFQRRWARQAYQSLKDSEAGKILQVGVNIFRSEEEEKMKPRPYRADYKRQESRIADLRELRRNRDNKKVAKALDEVKAMAAGEATRENNLMPPIIEAVKAYATVGEICDALREVWGEYSERRAL